MSPILSPILSLVLASAAIIAILAILVFIGGRALVRAYLPEDVGQLGHANHELEHRPRMGMPTPLT